MKRGSVVRIDLDLFASLCFSSKEAKQKKRERTKTLASLISLKNVAMGIMEYIGCAQLNQNEVLSMEFGQEITIDDVSVKGTAGKALKLELVYPSSSQTATLATSIEGTWFLNDAQNQAGKRWYHLPARTKLVLTMVDTGSAHVSLLVLGRSS